MSGDTRSTGSQGVAKCNGTAVYIQFVYIQTECIGTGQRLNTERFIDLNE